MAWIESHIDLGDHPKTFRLAEELRIPVPYAVGLLHLLWHFALRHAWRNGDLKRYTISEIARTCKWDGKPEDFITALQKTGWLDDFKCHDWLDFAGRLVKDRLRYNRANKTRTGSVRNTAGLRRGPVANHTVPYHTLPNSNTVPAENKPAPLPIPYQEFLEAWNVNGGALPRASTLTDKRREKIRLRWLEKPSLDYWGTVICRMAHSTFMLGKSDRGWIADFDWLIANDTNHVKVMEGKYDDRGETHASNGSESIFKQAARLEAARKTEGLRKVAAAGQILAGVRGGPDVPAKAKADSG